MIQSLGAWIKNRTLTTSECRLGSPVRKPREFPRPRPARGVQPDGPMIDGPGEDCRRQSVGPEGHPRRSNQVRSVHLEPPLGAGREVNAPPDSTVRADSSLVFKARTPPTDELSDSADRPAPTAFSRRRLTILGSTSIVDTCEAAAPVALARQ